MYPNVSHHIPCFGDIGDVITLPLSSHRNLFLILAYVLFLPVFWRFTIENDQL